MSGIHMRRPKASGEQDNMQNESVLILSIQTLNVCMTMLKTKKGIMSRCFPYNQNGATIEALINPIKLQKEKSEKSKAKAEKKEKKRAKKEQKQKEKEKRKVEEKRTVQKSSTVDSTKALIKTLELTKTSELTIEQRERSDLTEERGQPISSQQSYSSDSTQNTQNSNKRKRDDAVLPDASGGHG
nr:hypothetical protein [Tanacetum cinerariifolium]